MHDTVIKGGTIVDGSGKPSFTGDIAIDGDTITQVGGKAGPAKREIKADGLTITPGWVDVHTHYDGQATWDPELAPSSWHGVTTILFGNCGVGFAPVRGKDHSALIGMMESIEEIPGIVLADGLKWNWETFPDYLDALEGMPRSIDVAAQIPHHPLRVYVMGDRAINREAATADDIAAMRDHVRAGLKAGAFGFTTSRTNSHKTPDGSMVPGRYSEVDELLGIGSAFKGLSHGAFGMNSDFDDEEEELAWMTKFGQDTGRPIWFLLTDRPTDITRWKRLIGGVHKARAAGAKVTAQVPGRPVGVLLGIDTALNPFSIRPSYQALLKLPVAERMQRLQDPAFRQTVLNEAPSPALLNRLSQFRQHITTRWHRMFPMENPPNYEPEDKDSIAAIAKREGRTPDEVAYDYLAASADRFLFFPVTGYNEDNLDVAYTMLTDEGTLLGLSDGGAHCSSIIDASMPSWMLMHWGRDRTRGPRIPVETLVKRQTSETADFFGFHDRGRLEAGKKADINVIDYQNLHLHIPEVRYDLPMNGRRLLQRVDGYRHTLVSGVPTFEDGVYTGATPGKLVRAAA
ncbi:MAG TPA: amidohydrolase family protein [Rhodopila sp.]|uniref:N-acyl-D-amino-acid deacylase family protein n=1 Tax=Rhodopila sp. TaxID=2480087 RepID=UPI002C8C7F5F|nr:amidohydrolase family protein [Rhodopila sp.]HVY17226.1 amidohydrolase family protein [Rhodopila sp.]